MLVTAKAKGFYGGELRTPGEQFEVKDGEKATWFESEGEPVVEVPKTAEKKAK